MRVGLLHLGQSVDFVVSITFSRCPVFAILAIWLCFSFWDCLCAHPRRRTASTARSLARLLPQKHSLEGSGTRCLQFTSGQPAPFQPVNSSARCPPAEAAAAKPEESAPAREQQVRPAPSQPHAGVAPPRPGPPECLPVRSPARCSGNPAPA